MKNLKLVTATLMGLVMAFNLSFASNKVSVPTVENRGGIYYIEVDAATSFDRGYQQGAALKHVIAEGLADFDTWVTEHSDYANSTEFANDFNKQTTYLSDLETNLPDLHQELMGMAEGADVSVSVLFLYNSLDEYLAFLMEKSADVATVAHCTTTGVFGRENLPNFVTHNNDLMTIFSNRVVVTKITYPESNLVIMQTGFAGTFAQNGVNNYGVGVGCNIIVDMERNTKGLPVAFNTRKILETKSLKEAKEYLASVPSAQSMNYMVGDRNMVESLEVSGNGNVYSVTGYNGNFAAHTNHTLNPETKKVRDIISAKPSTAHTVERLDTAIPALEKSYKTIDTQGMKNLKSTAPIRINEKGAISQTIESVITEIPKEGNPILYVTNGLPNGDNYERFDF